MSDVEEGKTAVKFRVIAKTLGNEFKEHFPTNFGGLVESDPGGFVLTTSFGENAQKYMQASVRSDDVWVVTFPKCGTTWTLEMVWLLANSCDFEGAKELLSKRCPFFELFSLMPCSDNPLIGKETETYKLLSTMLQSMEEMKSPRVIKSHLPLFLLPSELLDKAKVVYVARNPKDALVSYFHHHKLFKIQEFSGDIEEFAEYFMKNQLFYTPYFKHIMESWALRDHPNLHFLFYEDMKRDLKGEIEKVANFLGKPVTEEQLAKLTEHLRVDNFAKNPAVNFEEWDGSGYTNAGLKFVRKGKTGDWKNHFSPELNSRIDEWIESNLSSSDLRFVTELEKQD